MATNSIGDFEFLALTGHPLRADDDQVVVKSRPGVDGVVLWLKGQRGRPFRLRSAVDAPTFTYARWLYGRYLTLKDHDPVPLVWGGINMQQEGFKVAVVEVEPVEVGAMMASAGGNNPPSYGWAEFDWTLVAIADT